jgi:hypothetical protein
MLSPEFFSSAPVNRLPIPAAMTFAGLWCYLDDFGRGEDDAALVKAVVWPRRRSHTESKVAADLDLIVAENLLCRYVTPVIHSQELVKIPSRDHAERLIHSPSWREHQRISHPTPSKFMPCPIHETELHAAYLRECTKFPESLARGSRPPPELTRNHSRASPPRARVEESLRKQDCRTAGAPPAGTVPGPVSPLDKSLWL